MFIFSKDWLISLGIVIPLIGVVWFFSGFYKKKVIIRWLIQMLVFLILSVVLITLGIIIFLVNTTTINVFWFGVTFRIGFYCFVFSLISIYFLITRGIIFPKRKKKAYEELKKHDVPEWQINAILKRFDD